MPIDLLPDRGERQTLKDVFRAHSAPAAGELVESLPDGSVRCHACGHRCLVKPGRDGVCRVRFNDAGTLRVPFGYVGAVACDPIEKKPFFHVLPGSDALTFGMLGCDFHCGYCQNWVTSQMLRDPAAVAPLHACSATRLVDLAVEHGASVIASSYNEPLITSEWAVAVFEEARQRGLLCAYVSNGNATERVLDYLRPHVSAYKVDLKTFDDRRYRQLGGVLEHVTATIRMLKQRQFWVELVTLVVPGFSDDPDDLRRMADFIADVDPLMPWHVTAFYPDYKFSSAKGFRRTEPDDLFRAVEIGSAAGLKYIYAGNRPGQMQSWEHTRCHHCGETVVERHGFRVVANRLTPSGACPACGGAIPGIWGESPGTAGDGRVRPVRL